MLTTLSSLVAAAPVAEEKRQTSVLALPPMTFTGTFPRPTGDLSRCSTSLPVANYLKERTVIVLAQPGQEPSRVALEPSRVPPVSQNSFPEYVFLKILTLQRFAHSQTSPIVHRKFRETN